MGDAAHQVSPFGARGANGALQGVENLGWKLAAVMQGHAKESLLLTYDTERQYGAKENILHSTRATDFMTPKNHITKVFRDTVLDLSRHYPFARALVNSGRLSKPCSYPSSPLNTPDSDDFDAGVEPGSPCPDAPVSGGNGSGWLLNHIGNRFSLLLKGEVDSGKLDQLVSSANAQGQALDLIHIDRAGNPQGQAMHLRDDKGILNQRYDLGESAVYLIRPDQHVAARWRQLDPDTVVAALHRALGSELATEQAA
jgi:3-(3-hydroxy-phenyl)propionate hydroxylase